MNIRILAAADGKPSSEYFQLFRTVLTSRLFGVLPALMDKSGLLVFSPANVFGTSEDAIILQEYISVTHFSISQVFS